MSFGWSSEAKTIVVGAAGPTVTRNSLSGKAMQFDFMQRQAESRRQPPRRGRGRGQALQGGGHRSFLPFCARSPIP